MLITKEMCKDGITSEMVKKYKLHDGLRDWIRIYPIFETQWSIFKYGDFDLFRIGVTREYINFRIFVYYFWCNNWIKNLDSFFIYIKRLAKVLYSKNSCL